MATDISGYIYATPAGRVSDGMDLLYANMPMDDWAKNMWEQQVAPQIGKPALKVVISKSSWILKTPSIPSPVPSGNPRAAMEALKKSQEAEAKRKKGRSRGETEKGRSKSETTSKSGKRRGNLE